MDKSESEVVITENNGEVEVKESLKSKGAEEAGEVSKSKTKKLSKMRKMGCCAIVLISVILIVAGLVGGVFVATNLNGWLEPLGISIDSLQNRQGSVTVVEKEKVVQVTPTERDTINVIEENMQSVVSVAVNEVRFSPGEGVVDQNSNIGSGFIVDPSGLIVTNQHVVSNTNATYTVVTESGDEYEVVEIVRDDVNDIAVLKVEAEGLNAVELGDSDALLRGQSVIAIGTPLGEYAGSVTTGVISGLNRSVTTSGGGFFGTAKTFEDVIQTDAAINPGNSGGPLLTLQGEVIGINFATSANADNISFALPINRVKARLEEYRAYGRFLRPYVGIEYQMITPAEAQVFDNVEPGAFVRNVVDNSPADQAGLKRGDIITHINGKELTGSFVSAIQIYKPGDKIKLTYVRNGEASEVELELGEVETN